MKRMLPIFGIRSSLVPTGGSIWIVLLPVALCLACSDPHRPIPSIVRWADPDRIASFESECPDLYHGDYPLSFGDLKPFAVLDAETEWYPFLPAAERFDRIESAKTPERDAAIDRNKGKVVLDALSGIFQTIPFAPQERTPIFIECRAHFDPDDRNHAFVIQLTEELHLAKPYEPGILKKCLENTTLSITRLIASDDRRTASRIVAVTPNTRSLLFAYVSGTKEREVFEWVKFGYLKPWHQAVANRKQMEAPHPAIDTTPFIGGVVRPSLFVPPGSSITLKPMTLYGKPEFQCALGVIGEGDASMSFTIIARDSDGEMHEIVRRRLPADLEDWIPVHRDLSRLAGHKLTFTVSCDWEGLHEQDSGLPPLVYCGSPMIRFEDFSRPDPDYNLILVSIDTLRPDRLGCYGYSRPVSPNLDCFAEQNLLCRNVHSQSPYTLPSHASLFSSLFPSSHGVQSVEHRLSGRTDLLAEILARQGMATASFSGGGLLSHRFGFARGFDLWCEVDPLGDRFYKGLAPTSHRMGDGSAGSFNVALDWIRDRRDRPFFLFLHTFMVHDYLPPARWADLFNEGCGSGLVPGRDAQEIKKRVVMGNRSLSDEDLTFFKNMYDATVRASDRMLGELFNHLRTLGIEDRTVVVITSDHGEEFMEHGNMGHTRSVYEESIRIPLIMKVPGIRGGRVIDTALNQVDIVPTVLEIMGIASPVAMQGRSFVDLLSGRDEPDRAIFAEIDLPKISRRACLVQDGWKFIEGSVDRTLRCPAVATNQLFRLDEDPSEQRDLFGSRPVVERRLKEALKRFRKNIEKARQSPGMDESSSAIPPELYEVLKQQGYM